ncbi:MAG: hypothetical protein QGG39_01620 [Candidatus Poribacteria bacterium]|nr:hypothetical protein [Candidatus Poribacteria bacterium]
MKYRLITLLLGIFLSMTSWAIEPPTEVRAVDVPGDDGSKGIQITWNPTIDSIAYRILRREALSTDEPTKIGEVPADQAEHLKDGRLRYIDQTTQIKTAYVYQVAASTDDSDDVTATSEETAIVKAVGNLFHRKKSWILVFIVTFTALTLVFIQLARSGRKMFIRNISALDAVEESVGRATEMGRPIFFIPGLQGLDSPATIAAINIFESVASEAIQDQTRMVAPSFDPIVMNVMQSSLKEVCIAAGRPDMYSEDDVFFVNDRQFAYVAAVDGMIARDKPATVFLQGYFYAESLILAEVAHSIGAIQIAGTSSDTQLPFFIAACDYTLIGEELFAAGAYIKKDALQLGTLKAQDLVKLLLFGLMVLGGFLVVLDINWILNLFSTTL